MQDSRRKNRQEALESPLQGLACFASCGQVSGPAHSFQFLRCFDRELVYTAGKA